MPPRSAITFSRRLGPPWPRPTGRRCHNRGMTGAFDEADRAELLEALAHQRSSVRSIVGGLDEEAWHTSVVLSGWTPAGLVVHLGDAERHWTGVIVDHDPGHPFDEERVFDRNAAFVTDWSSTKVLAYYQDQTNSTDETLAVTALAAAPLGHHGGPDSYQPPSVRAIAPHRGNGVPLWPSRDRSRDHRRTHRAGPALITPTCCVLTRSSSKPMRAETSLFPYRSCGRCPRRLQGSRVQRTRLGVRDAWLGRLRTRQSPPWLTCRATLGRYQ